MSRKMKMIAAITLVLGVISVAFLAAPIQAYVNRTDNGDPFLTQDRDRLRTQDCDCDCTCTQYHIRQRVNQCATSKICNCTMTMEQYRSQKRERTRSPEL